MVDDIAVPPDPELTATQKSALVIWYICHGERMTTRQIAELVGLTLRGAECMMGVLSQKLPIYQEESRGIWLMCE